MKSTIVFVVIFILQQCGGASEDKLKIKDSYLQAYYNSKTSLASSSNNKNERIDKYYPVYEHSGPEKNYGPPHHGFPEQSYGPPNGFSESYGPPVYGPPSYGPPPHHHQGYPMSFPGMPHALMGLLDKLHLKLDIFTILKIILKLVIFKKLISFIAILCLLLFIPKFKPKVVNMDDDDELRSLNTKSRADEHINVLTNYVVNAIEKYSGNTNKSCEGIVCESSRILRDIDRKYSYERLVTLYSQDS